MGAGQIGGIASLLDIDFNNEAGFLGEKAVATEGQFIVYYFSHAMMFCVGALIEAHIVLTPASCVFGERHKFEVYGGAHTFIEHAGVSRVVHHLSIHRGYNHTQRWMADDTCTTDNLAILVLSQQFSFNKREYGSEFVLNRVRYGVTDALKESKSRTKICKFFGWGSRRNGYLIPLLIHLRGIEVTVLPQDQCSDIWNKNNKYLCIRQQPCRSEKYGALCPDDVGSVLVCSGFAQGMMISRLVDRPCGVGFLDLTQYNKFLTCGVDDSRDVMSHEEFMAFDFTSLRAPPTPAIIIPPTLKNNSSSEEDKEDDKKDDKEDDKDDDDKDDDKEDDKDEDTKK